MIAGCAARPDTGRRGELVLARMSIRPIIVESSLWCP
jgi:hypothetical protein